MDGRRTVDELTRTWQFAAPKPDLVSVNAHFEHWRALPAAGDGADPATLFYNFNITNTNNYTNQIGFSMGCHAGLNVPDASVADAQTQPDFPQAFAQRGAAAWLANTGYGYGMDDAVALSEQLMLFFTQELGADSSVPIGQALVHAKQRYVGSAPSGGFSVYDEKSLIEATLYGLPMLHVSMPVTQPIGAGAVTAQQSAPSAIGALARITVTVQLTPTGRTTVSGTYYSLGGEAQGYPGRPVQPRSTVVAEAVAGGELRGLLLIGAVYSEVVGVNPLVSIPVTDTALAEPAFEADGWFPVKFWAPNRFGDQERLAIVGGQYNRDGGVERLYSNMLLESYYASPLVSGEDYLPPTIWAAHAVLFTDTLQFRVAAEDFDSGMARVLVTYNVLQGDGTGEWRSVDLTYDPNSDVWFGGASASGLSGEYFVQVMDAAGNVTLSANKGEFFAGETFETFLPLVIRN